MQAVTLQVGLNTRIVPISKQDLGLKLIDACYKGDENLAHELLDFGADVTVVSNSDYNALTAACTSGLEQIALRLIDLGSDVNHRTFKWETPLSLACSNRLVNVIMRLLDLNVVINNIDKQNTLLLVACNMNLTDDVIIKLIDKGANINVQDRIYSDTPLIIAINLNRPNIVFKLIDSGAYVNIANLGGNTALIYAFQKGMLEVVLKIIQTKSFVYIDKYDNLHSKDETLQRAMCFNCPQYPLRYEFTLNDLPLLTEEKRKIIETLTQLRSFSQSNLSLMPNELLQMLLNNVLD